MTHFACHLAWGSVWRHLDDTLKDRMSLISFLDLPSTKVWLNRSEFSMLEYWERLSEYKYSVCPPGNGIQTPKIYEAILSRTVPVTLRSDIIHRGCAVFKIVLTRFSFCCRREAFVNLKALGLPMLLVSSWSELSVWLLESAYEEEFRDVDWDDVHNMLSPTGLLDTLLSWEKSIPLKSKKRFAISRDVLQYYFVN